MKITKEHTIKPKDCGAAAPALVEESPKTCALHPGEPLKLFCDTCDRLTCRDCQLLEHKDHRYFFLEEGANKVTS